MKTHSQKHKHFNNYGHTHKNHIHLQPKRVLSKYTSKPRLHYKIEHVNKGLTFFRDVLCSGGINIKLFAIMT